MALQPTRSSACISGWPGGHRRLGSPMWPALPSGRWALIRRREPSARMAESEMLGPRAMQLLACLARRRDEVVGSEALIGVCRDGWHLGATPEAGGHPPAPPDRGPRRRHLSPRDDCPRRFRLTLPVLPRASVECASPAWGKTGPVARAHSRDGRGGPNSPLAGNCQAANLLEGRACLGTVALRNKRRDPAIPDMSQVSRLSEEQLLCLRGVLAGLTSAQIASETGLPVARADSLLRAAVRDLGVGSRTEAALLVAAVEGCLPTLAPAAPQPAPKKANPSAPGRAAMESLGFEPFVPHTKFIPDETTLHHKVREHYEDSVQRDHPLDLRGETSEVGLLFKLREPVSINRLGILQRVLFILLISFASSVMLTSLVMAIAALESLR